MALRLSDALRNFIHSEGSLKQAISGGKLKIYTGAQPASANDAVSGSLLVTFTASGGAHTQEVRSSGTFKLSSGSSGSVDTVTVNSIDILGGAVAYNTSLTQTAADVATQINRNPKNLLFNAAGSGQDVIITARPGLGTLPNTWVVNGTTTTLVEGTHVDMASGVNSANGLQCDDAASGVLAKLASQTWQGTAVLGGTAGWWRFEASEDDPETTDSAARYLRLDGNCGTSGANMNMATTTIANGAVQTLSAFQITLPASA